MTDLQAIQHLPMPPHSVVKSLATSIAETQYQSILVSSCQHSRRSAIPSMDHSVLGRVNPHLQNSPEIGESRWVTPETEQDSSWDTHIRPQTHLWRLQCSVVWNRKIQGFSTSVGTEYLAAYATIEWLNNEHMTHMLDLLRCDVIWQGLSQRVEVE